MTQFTQDTVAIQDAEARGTGFGYGRLGIPDVLRWCSASTSRAPWMTTTRP